MDEREEMDMIFSSIKESLPKGWLQLSEELKLHHLLQAINLTLRPKGTWILVDGDRSLLDLLNAKTQ